MMAEHGVLVQGENGPLFVLENGNRQEMNLSDPKAREISVLHFESYTLDLAATARPPEDRDRKPKELYIHELLYPTDPSLSDDQRQQRIIEAHKRLTWPLNALVFATIGITILLRRRHDRQGPARGMMLAVITVVVVQALSTASASLAERSPALLPLLYLVPLTPIIVCLALLPGGKLNPMGQTSIAARSA